MKKRIIYIPLLLALIASSYMFFLNPWSRLFNTTIEIDINSGQYRKTQHIIFIPIIRTISDTWVSLEAEKEKQRREWHKVTVVSPLAKNSPNYIYHSALGDIGMFSGLTKGNWFESDALRLIANEVMKSWKVNGNSYQAGQFLMKIQNEAFERIEDRPIKVRDTELLIQEHLTTERTSL